MTTFTIDSKKVLELISLLGGVYYCIDKLPEGTIRRFALSDLEKMKTIIFGIKPLGVSYN